MTQTEWTEEKLIGGVEEIVKSSLLKLTQIEDPYITRIESPVRNKIARTTANQIHALYRR